jgi:hypothetical protein
MREIRQSGSEGGEPHPNAASLPLSSVEVVTKVESKCKKESIHFTNSIDRTVVHTR